MQNKIVFTPEIWKESNSYTLFHASTVVPKGLPITSVRAYVLVGQKLLLAKVPRGWDLPGGHIEAGEDPMDAVLREVHEETGVLLRTLRLVGFLKIVNDADDVTNSKYPLQSCMLIYFANIPKFATKFSGLHESTARRAVSINNISQYHHNWTKSKEEILNYAVMINGSINGN
jgi:8-oxo-dGTP diphosphatase